MQESRPYKTGADMKRTVTECNVSVVGPNLTSFPMNSSVGQGLDAGTPVPRTTAMTEHCGQKRNAATTNVRVLNI